MKTLPIDLGELSMALEDSNGGQRNYLDLETGRVILVWEDSDLDEDREAVEANPIRYLPIEPLADRKAFRIMEAFVAQLPESEAQRDLARVLSWAKPFRNFKEALYHWPDVRQRWFAFREAELEKRTRQWLAFHEIESLPAPSQGAEGSTRPLGRSE